MGLAQAGAEERVIRKLHATGTIDATALLADDSDAVSCADSVNAEGADAFSNYVLEMSTLSPNQTIVGIYGVKDETSHFTSLGFILKEQIRKR